MRLLLAASLGLLGCARTHAPLATPTQEIPHLSEVGSLAPGETRLVVDANGESARVSSDGTTICAVTPCAVSVPQGAHRLTFFANEDIRRFGDVDVDLGARPTVVRHALTVRHESPGWRAASIVAFSLGGSLVAIGGATASGQLLDDGRPWGTIGGSIAAAGLIGVALGITFALAGRSDVWPGSTRTWVVPPKAP